MKNSLKLPTERSAAVHGRILQLDGLRAVAILAVLVNHTLHVPLTWAGVDIFFVLSGFLITGILLARKRSSAGYFSYFYRRRIFRILPSYFVTLLIFGLIYGWTTFHPWPLLVFFGMNIQPFWVPHANPLPLWSLAVEEQFYLVWPVIILLVSETVLLRLAVAAVLVTPFLRAVCTHWTTNSQYIYMLTPFRADLLCAGAVLAILWKNRKPGFEERCRARAWIGVLAGFGGLAFVYRWPSFRVASNTSWSNGLDYSLSLIGAVSLLAWVLADRSWLKRFLSSSPMRYIGEISYTMYLVHIIVLFLIMPYVASEWLRLLFVTMGTILWATISWFFMERPFIRFAATGNFRSQKQKILV